MEEEIKNCVKIYYETKKINYEQKSSYKRLFIKNKELITDADLLRYVFYNINIEKKEGDYFSLCTSSLKFYFEYDNYNNRNLELIYSYIIEFYQKDINNFYKYIEILKELSKKNLIAIRENNFTKENSDEIKIFSKYLNYYINNDIIYFGDFIYIKYFDKSKDIIKNDENKIIKLIYECPETLEFFDEIYDTKNIKNLNKYIIEFNQIYNNKLLITNEEKKFVIQFIIKNYKDICQKIELLIKKIKNIFQNIQIILYIDEYTDSIFSLFKQGFISNLIIKKKSENNNLIMLSNNESTKDIFLLYDIKEKLIEEDYDHINNFFKNYFDVLYIVFNKDFKYHKIKVTKDLSEFSFYIKDYVEQNYFNINEYNEEKKNYNKYLYSKNNKFCYEIFCLKFPFFNKIFSLFFDNINIKDNKDSLIIIKGYELIIKASQIKKKFFYNKIYFQESNEIDDDYIYKEEYEKILELINIGFNTKNIYVISDFDKCDFINDNNAIIKKKAKRGFNDLLPVFYFIYKKYSILNKKPILLDISYFMSYELNIYKDNIDN